MEIKVAKRAYTDLYFVYIEYLMCECNYNFDFR